MRAARQNIERFTAVARDVHSDAFGLEHARQGKHIAHIVLDDQHAAALEHALSVARGFEHLLMLGRQFGFHLVQEQRDFAQEPLRRACVLDDDRLGITAQPLLFLPVQGAPRVNDDRRKSHVFLLRHLLQQIIAAQIRQVEIDDHAIESGVLEFGQRFACARDCRDLHLAVAQQLPHAFPLTRVVLDDQHPPHTLRKLRFQAPQRLDELFALRRLQCIADRAQFQCLAFVVRDRDHVNRDVPRARIALQRVEHAEPGMIGQVHVQEDCTRQILPRGNESLVGGCGGDALKAHLVHQIAQNHRESGVVFDQQYDSAARRDRVAIIFRCRRRRHRRLRRGYFRDRFRH